MITNMSLEREILTTQKFLLEVDSIQAGEGKRELVKKTSFSIEQGEVVIVTSENDLVHSVFSLIVAGALNEKDWRGSLKVIPVVRREAKTSRIEDALRKVFGLKSLTHENLSPKNAARKYAMLLRKIAAIVDAPDLNSPDEEGKLKMLISDELFFASKPAMPWNTKQWAKENGYYEFMETKLKDLNPSVHFEVSMHLAAMRKDVRFLIMTRPDYITDNVSVWFSVAKKYAEAGYGVIVTTRNIVAKAFADYPHEKLDYIERKMQGGDTGLDSTPKDASFSRTFAPHKEYKTSDAFTFRLFNTGNLEKGGE